MDRLGFCRSLFHLPINLIGFYKFQPMVIGGAVSRLGRRAALHKPFALVAFAADTAERFKLLFLWEMKARLVSVK